MPAVRGAFASEGADVVIADVDSGGNAATERRAAVHGGRVLAVRCDVTSADDGAAAQPQIDLLSR